MIYIPAYAFLSPVGNHPAIQFTKHKLIKLESMVYKCANARHQAAMIWTCACVSPIGSLKANSRRSWIKIHNVLEYTARKVGSIFFSSPVFMSSTLLSRRYHTVILPISWGHNFTNVHLQRPVAYNLFTQTYLHLNFSWEINSIANKLKGTGILFGTVERLYGVYTIFDVFVLDSVDVCATTRQVICNHSAIVLHARLTRPCLGGFG